MSARALALGGILGLLLLQFRWHAMIAPPATLAPWAFAAFYCIPLLPSLVLLALRRPSALLVGAIAALLYFCHGVMFAFGAPVLRAPAFTEIALSVLVVVAASWGGLSARFAKKKQEKMGSE